VGPYSTLFTTQAGSLFHAIFQPFSSIFDFKFSSDSPSRAAQSTSARRPWFHPATPFSSSKDLT